MATAPSVFGLFHLPQLAESVSVVFFMAFVWFLSKRLIVPKEENCPPDEVAAVSLQGTGANQVTTPNHKKYRSPPTKLRQGGLSS